MEITIQIVNKEEKIVNDKQVITVTGLDGNKYTHWVDAANKGWEQNLKVGSSIQAYLSEKPNPRNPRYPYKNIYPLKGSNLKTDLKTAQPTISTPNNAVQPKFSPTMPPDWDKISWGKCKHAFLVELMKKQAEINLGDIDNTYVERIAEEWANASMRKLPTYGSSYDDHNYPAPEEPIINTDEIN